MIKLLARPGRWSRTLKQSGLKRHLPPRLLNRFKIYNYYVWMLYDALTGSAQGSIRQALKELTKTRWRILFYPDVPWEASMLYQLCLVQGYAITDDPASACDLAVKWRSATYVETDAILQGLATRRRVLNLRCSDISKARVERLMKQVFGYSAAVDPLSYHGKCVQKSNWNARHDGKIIECPVLDIDSECVYERLIGNDADAGMVMDLRVPVIGRAIPFVFLYFRRAEVRFSAAIQTIKTVETAEVLSDREQEQILLFCDALGLDYGELDVLRDNADGRIYIVDANPTPHGPPADYGRRKQGVKRLAAAFQRAFLASAEMVEK